MDIFIYIPMIPLCFQEMMDIISIMEYPHQLLSISITILMRLLSHILLLMIHFYYYPFLLLQKIMRKPTKYPFISLLFPYSHPCISHYSHIFTRLYPIIPINKSLISQDSPVFSSIFRRLYGNHGCFYMFL